MLQLIVILVILFRINNKKIHFLKKKGVVGYDLPGLNLNCAGTSDVSPDQCRSKCKSTAGCFHYTWFFSRVLGMQRCCLKYGFRSYSSAVPRSDLAPIVSEIF